ncbi:hypothetical protein [Pedobacter foliorum]|uniref:hypothetical protein n=1 Tax=Pedobacter foliorum TaxID=2739058 RepID=UPI0015636720|nr:hypothetical protein [Pedobacter foliorum]NRF41785.1 hypothetical protein [Pedobacter foliorum]
MEALSKYPNIEFSGSIKQHGLCIIDSRVHGLFASFYCILYGLYICEMEDIEPIILLGPNHLYYEEEHGSNIFNYFYSQEYDAIPELGKILVVNPIPFLYWCRISTSEKLKANMLIKKYFNLQIEFKKLIRLFKKENFGKSRILGVHYRGTDKIQETDLLPFRIYVEKIDFMLKNNMCDRIFFSTDELRLRLYMEKRYKKKLIMYDLEGDYKDTLKNNKGLHFSTSSPFLHAKDALMECYLLSDCTMLLSSHKSSMSLFATFLNPNLIHIIIEP